jgi:glycosyltransferase involved in cell wall biosynthesis
MSLDQFTDDEKLLYSNKQYFDASIRIAQKLFEEELYEDCINYIQKTAYFGWFNFSGYYKSHQLEILLAKIQQKILPPFSSHHKSYFKTNKVLHICSEVHISGGHSKLLYNWIKNDVSKKHSILTTRQSVDELKSVSENYIDDILDIEYLSVKSDTIIESVKLLNQLQLNSFDVIILHIHPDETITNIVFSQKEITTPLWFINHADHVFWLGTSVADKILQIRDSNINIDLERRGISIERQFYLPIPIDDKSELNDVDIKDGEKINILTTGTSYKFNPNEKYNFLREAYKIVQENPNVVFNIVGLSQDSKYAQEYQHTRIILHGGVSISQLEDIEKSTHIYVEGFPMASFTALLQTALRRVPFVLHYQPLPLFKLFNESNDNAIIYPKNLDEWHSNLTRLIKDRKSRIETIQKQHEYISNNFSIKVWKSRVAELYNQNTQPHSFWESSPDIYYNGDNEKLLVTIDKRKISHYDFTEGLSLCGKISVYLMSKSRNINVNYIGKKRLLRYLLNKL